MKFLNRSLALCAAGAVAAVPLAARANVLNDIQHSISSLWGQKAQQQSAAKTALKQATAKKHQAEWIEDRLEKTALLLDRANENYRNYATQLSQTEARLVETRHREQIATARYKEHNRQFGLRLASLQKSGEPQMISVILGSNSLSELSRRASFLRTLGDNDARLQADLKSDRLEMTRAQNLLMEQWQSRVRLARSASDEQTRIAQNQRQQQAIWHEVNASKAALLRIADAQQRASDSIGTQIQDLEARKTQITAQYEAEAQTARQQPRRVSYDGGSTSNESYADENFADGGDSHASGGWMMPARGRISSRFGMRYHPILHREKLHTGEDIAAGYGAPFRAARGGRVLYAGWQTAYGKTIIIDTGNGTTTLYGHASKLDVSAGQSVKTGQTIGNVGSTGWSTGPHLHFEVRKNGSPVNPAQFVK